MATRPPAAQLLKMVEDGTYQQHVRSAMEDFCFTIDVHEGRDRAWFGSYTVAINRNIAFSFFDRDVTDDPGLEPYPVVQGERTEAREIRVRHEPEDPSTETVVVAFYLAPSEYRAAVDSIQAIKAEYRDLRTIPDVYFADSPLIRLLKTHLLVHPRVQADRAADWPDLLR